MKRFIQDMAVFTLSMTVLLLIGKYSRSQAVSIPQSPIYVGVRGHYDSKLPLFSSPEYWANTAVELSRKVPNSEPCLIWIVGVAADDRENCVLSFPSKKEIPYAQFKRTDETEKSLQFFDQRGISVWLQVEPSEASVPELMEIVMKRYGHHLCVRGFAVDLEWYKYKSNLYGKPAAEMDVQQWLSQLHGYQALYTLVLKHWLPNHLPQQSHDGLVYLTDSQRFEDFAHQQKEFKEWGANFQHSAVGYQIGYETDQPWWKKLKNPFEAIARPLTKAIPNTRMILWVNFTIRELYPG